MSVSVQVNGFSGVENSAVFGRMARKTNVELVVRANNPINFFDISGKEVLLTKINSATLLTPQGIKSNGDGGVMTTLDESNFDNFTIFSVAKLDATLGSASVVNNWCIGNYTAAGTGIGLYLREVANGANFNLVLRAVFYYRTAANTTASQFVDMTLLTAVPARPSLGAHFFAMSQSSDASGNAVLSLYCPSMGLAKVETVIAPAANVFYNSAKRKLNWAGAIPKLQIGSVPAAGSIDSNAHWITTKETQFIGAKVTDQEVIDQYVQTAKWLAVDGSLDISGWVGL